MARCGSQQERCATRCDGGGRQLAEELPEVGGVGEELMVGAARDDPTGLEDEDLVGLLCEFHVVCDEQRCGAADEVEGGGDDLAPFGGVEAGGRFVEDEDRAVADQGACDRDAVPLAAGERRAALGEDGIEPIGQLADEVGEARGLDGGVDLFVVGVRAAVAEVVGDREPEEDGILLDDGDLCPQ